MTAAGAPADPWLTARRAVLLLALAGPAIGGLWLRARPGPARQAVTEALAALPFPWVTLSPETPDDALDGGIDLAATLSGGQARHRPALLAAGQPLRLSMAERAPARLAARLGLALDDGAGPLLALDEGAEADEALAPGLADRLGLFVALDGVSVLTDPPEGLCPDPAQLDAARARLPSVRLSPRARGRLVRAAAGLGIGSARALTCAALAARGLAAWDGRSRVSDADLEAAARLVFPPRAAPSAPPDAPPADPPPPPETPPDDASDGTAPAPAEGLPDELLVEAVRAVLPAGLLDQLQAARAARAARSGAGAGGTRTGNRRGRPLPSRAGRLGSGARIDIVATLRTAAPWQRLRAPAPAGAGRLRLRLSDLRLRRFEDRSDRVLVFAVDASGSQAFARLAEAKGAVELLLGQAYARRDHVALIAFRGTAAELALPPTRSLVMARRRLQGLPGGGTTPLAAGLRLASDTALRVRAAGMTPTLALLTDGRGNIALDGTPDRAAAEAEARDLARRLRAAGMPAIVIDTGQRPTPALRALSLDLGATYLALPRADAGALSAALGAAIGA